MKPEGSSIFDFSDDGQSEDESFLLRDGDDDSICWHMTPRPLSVVLKAARLRLGPTQQEMAELMGVRLRSYKGYELQDVRKVPATALQLLSECPAYQLWTARI